MYLPTPLEAQTWSNVHTRLSSPLQPRLVGPLYRDAVEVLAIPKDAHGKPGIHDTTVYRAFAKWADDGSLLQAFLASVAHLAAEKQLDLRVLHGDGTNTVAKKGVMGLATRATSTRRGRR